MYHLLVYSQRDFWFPEACISIIPTLIHRSPVDNTALGLFYYEKI